MDLSFLGPSAAVVIVVGLFMNFMARENAANRSAREDEVKAKAVMYEKLTKSIDRTADASHQSMRASKETSALIRNLNGKLTQAIIDKEDERYHNKYDKEKVDKA